MPPPPVAHGGLRACQEAQGPHRAPRRALVRYAYSKCRRDPDSITARDSAVETVSGAARNKGPPDPSVSQHFGLDWSQPRTDVNLEIYTLRF
jgi:hypothetical protein